MTATNKRWLNSTVLGVGLASFFSDFSHEIATAIMPAFLATIGASAAALGLIEGVSDGLSSFAKLGSGFYTDKLPRRKPIAVGGYIVTAIATASFAFATNAWHVLAARSTAWLGRGIRTPVRKALLAASVPREAYGRAFGLERLMDTIGAVVGPLSAIWLLGVSGHNFRLVFAWTIVPGLLAALVIALLVRERERTPVAHISFGERLRALPPRYRQFLVAVGLFGAGDFAHSMLILLAAQKLMPLIGAPRAATAAVALYVLHNVFYAAFSYIAGWLGDRWPKNQLLALGYGVGALMALTVVIMPATITMLAAVFVLGGISVAMEETLEDSFCAELVDDTHHGMAFGVLATANGVGDLISSVVVGALWAGFGTSVAFSYSAALFVFGAILVARVRA